MLKTILFRRESTYVLSFLYLKANGARPDPISIGSPEPKALFQLSPKGQK